MKRGNKKLGDNIWQFSITAGLAHICIGATLKCLSLCYATQSHYKHETVKSSLNRNYLLSLTDFFVGFILGCLMLFRITIVRIHAAGDFYNSEYVEKWIRIATHRPDIKFYAYTRSWRERDGVASESMLQAITKLASLPNVQVWLSCDIDTGEPPRIPHTLRCYLQDNDDDVPDYDVDLFFRDKRKTIVKKVKNKIVCPVENGATKTTCSACKLCYTPELLHRVNAKIVKSNSDSSISGNAVSVRTSGHNTKEIENDSANESREEKFKGSTPKHKQRADRCVW